MQWKASGRGSYHSAQRHLREGRQKALGHNGHYIRTSCGTLEHHTGGGPNGSVCLCTVRPQIVGAWGQQLVKRHDAGEFAVVQLAKQYDSRLGRQVHNIFAASVGPTARERYEGNVQCMIVGTVDEERATNGVGALGDFKTIQNPIGTVNSGGGITKPDWTPLEA